MATVTKGRTFVSGEVVTPTKLNALVDSATVTRIETADISDAQITLAKLVATVQQALMPVGAVQAFAMNAAPTGWLAADGTEYSKTGIYAALFAAIGATYGETNGAGGAGTTHFRVPDLRASFVRGAGSDGVATAGAFGAKQADSVIAHTHSGTTGNDSPDHTHGYSRTYDPGGTPARVDGSPGTRPWAEVWDSGGGASTRHQHPFTTSSQSPAGATETRPRNIAMLYCIKF